MKKLLLILLVTFGLFMFGCAKQEKVKVNIFTPGKSYTLTNELKIPIKGEVNDKKIEHFFYQIEDGHSFLGEGKIISGENGNFDIQIESFKAPSNQHGMLFFYLDEDQNGIFDQEIDTKTVIGSVELIFDEEIVSSGITDT